MKEVDDTPLPESKSEEEPILPLDADTIFHWISTLEAGYRSICVRVMELEKELALVLEQRETVRAPECQEDPEWF